jgi:hypothetical protein
MAIENGTVFVVKRDVTMIHPKSLEIRYREPELAEELRSMCYSTPRYFASHDQAMSHAMAEAKIIRILFENKGLSVNILTDDVFGDFITVFIGKSDQLHDLIAICQFSARENYVAV